MFLAVMGFNVGGGGIDGDGGIPDLDLLISIGHHRSILTHSVLPMIILEGVFFSLIGLVNLVHNNLPSKHVISNLVFYFTWNGLAFVFTRQVIYNI